MGRFVKNILIQFFTLVFGLPIAIALSFAAIIGVVFVLSDGGGGQFVASEDQSGTVFLDGDEEATDVLLAINIEGPIITRSPFGGDDLAQLPPGFTSGRAVSRAFREAAERPEVKGIFVSVTSPGGMIEPALEMSRAIQTYQDTTGHPVFVHVSGLSASAAVYATAPARMIFAADGALIGSIGVLGPSLDYFDDPVATDGGIFGGGVSTDGGIERMVIHSGKGKDLGNPFRRPSLDEIRNLQANADEYYDDFVRHMARFRPMDEAVIRKDMGAQIFSNKRAQKFGLIDGTAGHDEAIDMLAREADLINYRLEGYARGSLSPFAFLTGLFFGQNTKNEVPLACAQVAQMPLAMMSMVNGWGDCRYGATSLSANLP